MKAPVLFAVAALISCTALSEEPAGEPEYVAEAPLPEGWPTPGPYREVVEKSLPAYRAAFTGQQGENLAFWRLFIHIQQNKIPMTAPVEMAVTPEGDAVRRDNMAFLYQNTGVGQTGESGGKIEVRDVAPAKALVYAWQGPDSDENLAAARAALEAALAERKIAAEGTPFRLLGYNGPSTPRAKKTWELIAVLPSP
jgi:hypothetical protein